jgi:AAA family ATP:ADP antiporter
MVTAPKSGAEVIPFIKTYVNLPAAIGFTGIYASMTNRMEQKDVFYTCVWPFLAFFSLFALVIYPNRTFLHPFGFCDMLASHLPAGFSAPLAIVRNWSFALFYVMAEMWGSVVASLLFWGFANEVTTVDEAKKYCTLCCQSLYEHCCCWYSCCCCCCAFHRVVGTIPLSLTQEVHFAYFVLYIQTLSLVCLPMSR